MSIRTVVESLVGDGESPTGEDTESEDEWGEDVDDSAEFPEAGGIDGFEEADDDTTGLDDPFGEGSNTDGRATDELENRVGEVESEIESLSSTVETVQAENEHISASVDEVEENVRKLLDIYEMVTKGINPFADDVDSSFTASADGDFGLFEDDDEGEEDDELDDAVESADPEGFFDEDLPEDVVTEDPSFDDEGDFFGESADADRSSNGEDAGGTSFEDLKQEYEEGSSDESSGPVAATDDVGSDRGQGNEPPLDDPVASNSAPGPSEPEAGTGATDTSGVGTDGSDVRKENGDGGGVEDATRNGDRLDGEPPTPTSSSHDADADDAQSTDRKNSKPYLASIPSGYAGELLVHEWLAVLVDEVGVKRSAEALDYYESIGWIDTAVVDQLQARLTAHDGDGDGPLTNELHNQGLGYLQRLTHGSWNWMSFQSAREGDSSGIQH